MNRPAATQLPTDLDMNRSAVRPVNRSCAASLRARPARAATTALLLLAAPAALAVAEAPAPPAAVPPSTPSTVGEAPRATTAQDPEPAAPPSSLMLGVLEGPLGVSLVLNLGGRIFKSEEDTFDVTFKTWFDNLEAEWEYDPNKFQTNQLAHPYQGSLYFTTGRSLGLGFYTSAALTTLGSWFWETAMEIHPPSVNDQITTSVAGSLLGEVLYRLSSIALGGAEKPGVWRELGAAAIAPMHGVNRLAYGDKYRDRRVLGIPWYGEAGTSVGFASRTEVDGATSHDDLSDVTIAGRVLHGVPGAEGFRFRHPFDYFDATLSLTLNKDALGAQAFGSILIRGLVLGRPYGEGTNAGLWGLFAAYDYISPEVFRASSSNVAFGTVGHRELGHGFSMQGTAYAGVGFGAAGVAQEIEGLRDYHFGLQAVGLGELNLYWAQRVRLRGAARVYLVGEKLSPDADSYEDIQYGIADLVYRVTGPHALAVEYTGGRRKARYPDVPDVHMSVHQVGLSYRFVSDPGLGAAF